MPQLDDLQAGTQLADFEHPVEALGGDQVLGKIELGVGVHGVLVKLLSELCQLLVVESAIPHLQNRRRGADTPITWFPGRAPRFLPGGPAADPVPGHEVTSARALSPLAALVGGRGRHNHRGRFDGGGGRRLVGNDCPGSTGMLLLHVFHDGIVVDVDLVLAPVVTLQALRRRSVASLCTFSLLIHTSLNICRHLDILLLRICRLELPGTNLVVLAQGWGILVNLRVFAFGAFCNNIFSSGIRFRS
mmetsp:Transcript_91494/g.296117  ORF Transcript_91494/g.296117 Transcript_91494/m.296117 type:complete len:246 (+) Transcript_91494:2078-2815(+)